MFAILQKYDFSSKSQLSTAAAVTYSGCLRYCKSTIFQANHNGYGEIQFDAKVVCDTAKVRFFKQITTSAAGDIALSCCLRYCKSTIFQANHNNGASVRSERMLFAILQKYDFSSKSQLPYEEYNLGVVVCDTAKVRFFKQITTLFAAEFLHVRLFAILQKYDFSSKSQRLLSLIQMSLCCLRYCKSTIFQANHNASHTPPFPFLLFAILQKYDFSSKSQRFLVLLPCRCSCLRYCKSTIFQANHNTMLNILDGYGWER